MKHQGKQTMKINHTPSKTNRWKPKIIVWNTMVLFISSWCRFEQQLPRSCWVWLNLKWGLFGNFPRQMIYLGISLEKWQCSGWSIETIRCWSIQEVWPANLRQLHIEMKDIKMLNMYFGIYCLFVDTSSLLQVITSLVYIWVRVARSCPPPPHGMVSHT